MNIQLTISFYLLLFDSIVIYNEYIQLNMRNTATSKTYMASKKKGHYWWIDMNHPLDKRAAYVCNACACRTGIRKQDEAEPEEEQQKRQQKQTVVSIVNGRLMDENA